MGFGIGWGDGRDPAAERIMREMREERMTHRAMFKELWQDLPWFFKLFAAGMMFIGANLLLLFLGLIMFLWWNAIHYMATGG